MASPDANGKADLLLRLEEKLRREEERPLPLLLAAALSLLAGVYRLLYLCARLPYRLGLSRPIRLGLPVLGIGNLAAGGTGKTPCTIWLAKALQAAGWRPAVVSHGYRAGGRSSVTLVEPGAAEAGGDEARLAALSCPGVPVVSGRDRVAAAKLAAERFAPDVLLLDDAFQHWRLARDLDLVLLDAERPFGNGRLIPRGWLREPPHALGRAHALLLVGEAAAAPALPAGLPVYHARVAPASLTPWPAWRRGERLPAAARRQRVAAFSGLAKPERFWRTLTDLGLTVAERLVLPDHVSPEPAVFERWLRGLESPVVATTEKDAVRLTRELAGMVAASGRELLVLGVEMRPADGENLVEFLLTQLQMTRARGRMLQK